MFKLIGRSQSGFLFRICILDLQIPKTDMPENTVALSAILPRTAIWYQDLSCTNMCMLSVPTSNMLPLLFPAFDISYPIDWTHLC